MKLKASLSIEMEIDKDFLVEFSQMNQDGELSLESSEKEIQDYLNKNYDEISGYAEESAIDIIAEKCDNVSNGDYTDITVETIV